MRCRARAQSGSQMQARPDVRPSAIDAREEPSAVLTPCRGLRRAGRGSRWNRRNAQDFWNQMVSRHPGDLPAGQDLSLFFNTLKINRSGIILAFDRPLRRNSRCGPARWAARRGPGGGSSAPSWRWGRGRFLMVAARALAVNAGAAASQRPARPPQRPSMRAYRRAPLGYQLALPLYRPARRSVAWLGSAFFFGAEAACERFGGRRGGNGAMARELEAGVIAARRWQ